MTFVILTGLWVLAWLSGCGWLGRNDEAALPTILATPQPRPPVASPAQFTDITHAAGIDFRHNNGAFGLKLLPETMGSGAAFIDYDNDGYQDIFFVNGRDWTATEINAHRQGPSRYFQQQFGFVAPTPKPYRRTTGALYHNNGNGTFTDVTRGSGLDVEMQGMGVAVGDYDNDGKPDLYVTSYGRNYLFHNESMPGHPRFREVARQSGVAGAGYSTGAAWVDYDRDGLLDLFVCHYVQWTPGEDYWEYGSRLKNRVGGYLKDYATPVLFNGEASHLYHNVGHGQFVDVSGSAGLNAHFRESNSTAKATPATPGVSDMMAERAAKTVQEERAFYARPEKRRGKSLGIAICDFNEDGWPDLMVANDGVPNYLWQNHKDGTFTDVAVKRGVAYGPGTAGRSGMGVDTGDIDHSGHDSIVIGNFSYDYIGLYHDDGTHTFTDIAGPAEITLASRFDVTFGTLLVDIDNDGWLDILAANGHTEALIHNMQRELSYAQRPLLYINRRQTRPIKFAEVGLQSGAGLRQAMVGRGLACADIDLDGELDVLLTTNGGPPHLLRNQPTHPSQRNHALRLTLEGTHSNRSAIGAIVEAKVRLTAQAAPVTLRRTVKSGSSYLSQSELPLTFGLGQAAQVDSLLIHWPSGALTRLNRIAANQMLWVREGRGITRQQPLRR